jgi:hypothetical protein
MLEAFTRNRMFKVIDAFENKRVWVKESTQFTVGIIVGNCTV